MGSSPIGRPTDTSRPIAALILAGGSARRMGGIDKPLIELAGRAVLDHVLDRLRPHHDRIAISANGPPARFGRFGAESVLADERAGRGPLGGILAGLDWAQAIGAPFLLTVPGDAPFLPLDLAERLAPAPAMAARNGRRHPPVSLWPVSAATPLRAYLDGTGATAGRALGVVTFAATIGMRVVDFDGGGPDPFADIDTPDDLAAARARLRC